MITPARDVVRSFRAALVLAMTTSGKPAELRTTGLLLAMVRPSFEKVSSSELVPLA
jgi:hypothetical protein